MRNELFMPASMGIDPMQYEFYVFDRWGNMVFYTTDLTAGWDGSYKGQNCPIDTYVWKLSAVSITGEKYNQIGRVSLID